MKKLLLPLVLFTAINLAEAQVSDQDEPRNARDQVINDDLIVTSSECVGFDCVNGESFGFETIRSKENNLRIKFFDTSTGSFPTTDWQILANETANGGRNMFAIENSDLNRLPFTIEADARQDAVVIKSNRVGFGTRTPVTELHVKDGDTPTLRLEQDGSSGFTAQTWDIAGNETNFFIRDVTGGSSLPFRIRPGAPSSSIDIAAGGKIGMNISSPSHRLHVKNSLNADFQAIFADQPSDVTSFSSVFATMYLANTNGAMNSFTRLNFGDGDAAATAAVASQIQDPANNAGDLSFWTRATGGAITKRMGIQADGNIIIGTGNPDALLSVNGTASKPGGGTWAVLSDRRLKTDVRDYNDGLEQILKINPVSFRYNGKGGVSDTKSEFVGVIAQDIQEIAPYTVEDVNLKVSTLKTSRSSFDEALESDGKTSSENYLRFDPNALTYMLINATKDQQKIIEEQKEQMQSQEKRITDLEATVVELKNLIQDVRGSVEINLSGDDLGYLGQNVPNPYQGETSVTYVIPSKAQESSINIYDGTGKFVKSVNIQQTGKGQLKLNAQNLPGGIYSYQLVVDGKVVDSKKMLLQN
ncbi:MAG: tail fiber domain-containing protein [Saprospiraceae bacterium]|nr:tail fiber domain-containing protein [Saprospiraceae bacterium]